MVMLLLDGKEPFNFLVYFNLFNFHLFRLFNLQSLLLFALYFA